MNLFGIPAGGGKLAAFNHPASTVFPLGRIYDRPGFNRFWQVRHDLTQRVGL
jgi:hypothetical protein